RALGCRDRCGYDCTNRPLAVVRRSRRPPRDRPFLVRRRRTSASPKSPALSPDSVTLCGMSTITLTVNSRSHTLEVDPATPLLYVLSDDLALRGPKFGCGLGQCGACTVIVRGRAVRSCVT